MKSIVLVDLQKQYQAYKAEIDAKIKKVLQGSQYVLGQEVFALEQKLAQYVGVKEAVSCASGTDALILVLMSCGVKQGDEIITTPMTFIATAEAIALLGAKPVFVDVRDDTCNIDATKIAAVITSKTKGIIAVDMFGQTADYDEINRIARKHKLFVIEDAAQSFGSTYKKKKACSLGSFGCTSFFPAKTLGCYGDGGMVFTNSKAKADVMRSLRLHGAGKDKYDSIRVGFNSRLDTLQAAVLLAKFKYFPKELIQRRKIAEYYSEHLKDVVAVPQTLALNTNVYCSYCIRSSRRDAIKRAFEQKKIATHVYYPIPLHLQKAFGFLGYRKGDFPMTENICQQILAIPMHPFLTRKEQDFIIGAIRSLVCQ